MKVDRCYILFGRFNRNSQSGDGSDFFNIDLREIMGSLYDKYTRFNLKLESYHARTVNSSSLGNETQFLHIAGFPWINGFDTNPLYKASRVAATMFFEHQFNGDYQRGMLYPSNIATLMFARQASSRIQLEMFATDPASNTKLPVLFGGEDNNYLFSITGVDDAYPIYRQPEIRNKTSQLVLNARDATNLETNRRAIRWRVDLSTIIDSADYYKYKKFVLITKMIHINNVFPSFSGFNSVSLMMSGLDWFSPSLKLNSEYTGNRTFLNFHTGAPTSIAGIDADNNDFNKETFIDNVFYKPASPVVNLTITYNAIYDLALIGTTAPINPFVFLFHIEPVED